jgi:3-isopropylmalate/(R)-2-methylmalate dehydratase small subunit
VIEMNSSTNLEAIQGICVKIGNNVSTGDIMAAHYFKRDARSAQNIEELKEHCLESVAPGIGKDLGPRSIIVGGRNFGCGSSSEHALRFLKTIGIPIILAESFARTFYRNCINLGMPVLEGDPLRRLAGGEALRVNVLRGEVDYGGNAVLTLTALPSFVREFCEEGGLIPYILNHGDYPLVDQ